MQFLEVSIRNEPVSTTTHSVPYDYLYVVTERAVDVLRGVEIEKITEMVVHVDHGVQLDKHCGPSHYFVTLLSLFDLEFQ